MLSEYSYFGAVYAALENNANVVLCPFDNDSLTIDVNKLETLIDSKTKAILITHIWGNPCEMDVLEKIRNKHDVMIISDASHAHGSQWKDRKIGGLPCEDIACFSLGKGKLITGGELGIAVTDNKLLYDRLLMMGHPNRVPNSIISNKFKKFSNGFGIKLRPHALSLVIAKEQLCRYNVKLKNNIITNKKLESLIVNIPGFNKIKEYENSNRVYWKLVIALDKKYWDPWNTENIVGKFKEKGIPLEQFHAYDFRYENDIQINNRYSGQLINMSNMRPPDNLLFLPTFINLTEESIEYIVSVFKEISDLRRM